MEHCASCHNAWPYQWTEANSYGKRFVLVGLTPQTYVGTDRAQFDALTPLGITGELSKFLPGEFRGSTMLPKFLLNLLIGEAVQQTALQKLDLTEAQLADLYGYREFPPPPSPEGVYKAAPRDGVWATAPFMHNGSVPNLYEMLKPAAERTKQVLSRRRLRSGQSRARHHCNVWDVSDGHDVAGELERRSLLPEWSAR